jgi:ABC-type phosphate transport system substrate-binding protein
MKSTLLSLLAVSSLALVAHADKIEVVGSDLLDGAVVKPLEAFAESKHLEVGIDLFGSIPAMSQLRNDEAQLAFVARPDDGKFELEGYKIIPFAYQVAVIVVNDNNPLSELSLKQLGGVFGASSEQYYGRWGELGLAGNMATRSIQLGRTRAVQVQGAQARVLQVEHPDGDGFFQNPRSHSQRLRRDRHFPLHAHPKRAQGAVRFHR